MDINNLFIEHKMKIIIVVGIIILYIIYLLLKKYVLVRDTPNSLDKVIIPNGIDVNKINTIEKVITNNNIPALPRDLADSLIRNTDLTTFMYIYVSDYDTNRNNKKTIVFKPHNDNSTINFQWYFTPKKNDIAFEIRLWNGLNSKLTIKDIQLRTWVSVACVVSGNQANLYKNGKFYKSVVLKGIPVFINRPILLGRGYGLQTYTGFLGSFYHSYKAESEKFIKELHDNSKPKPPKVLPEKINEKCPTLKTSITNQFNILSSDLTNFSTDFSNTLANI
jgi:hypothetical protein